MKKEVADKKKILVVDDEQTICEVLQEFLTIKGYAVSTADTGEAALEKIKKTEFHFVLLDIKMPDITGLDVLKAVKKVNKKLPVIVMITAVKDDVIGQRCLELGAADYITKPLSLDYLENVLLVKLLEL